MKNFKEYFQSPPLLISEVQRLELTASCRDCEGIPKVDQAGSVAADPERGVPVQLMHNGLRVLAGGYYGDWMQELIGRLRGHHEPQEELIFHEVMKRIPARATMLELGGYWSYYSLWFLGGAPETRRSFVIEPDPKHIEVGRFNAALNGRAIDFVQGFVGEESAAAVPFPTETAGVVPMPRFAVPDFMKLKGIDHLDVLHCDVQGAETEVVFSCRDLFREGRITFCFVSTHSHYISGDPLTHQRCLTMLHAFGGKILAEHDVHESYSGDGLVVAYFGKEDISWPRLSLSYNRYSTSLFRNPIFDLEEALAKAGKP